MMNHSLATFFLSAVFTSSLLAAEGPLDAKRAANTIVLDDISVKNLKLQTAVVEEQDFETTAFIIGDIRDIPANHFSISSRIPGRAIKVNAFAGDHVKAGQDLVTIESRQPGSPPPTVTLKAPHDGLVIASNVHTGQPVDPDMQLFDLSDRSEVWAVAHIPQDLATTVKPGTLARIVIPAISKNPIQAKLLRFGVNADSSAGTLEGIFQIPNPGHRYQPGMRAEFHLILDKRENVLTVPLNAIQGDVSKRLVYVKDFELPNTYIRSPVVLGESNDQFAEVTSGLFPGDEVVTNGSYSLGFVGSGSGMSLKEALDAAHGHEHNEDGSEKTETSKNDSHPDDHDHEGEAAPAPNGFFQKILPWYAGLTTLATLILAQLLWNRRSA